MRLTLKVTSCRGLPPSEEITACFDQRSGTIGRADDNDLVLPDQENFISRRHADISYQNGRYSISDTSLSGTVIDHSETPLKKSSAELRDGMRIDIGEYELVVQIAAAAGIESFPGEPAESEGLLTDIIPRPDHLPTSESEAPQSFFHEEPAFESPSISDSEDPFAGFDDEKPVFDPLAGLEGGAPVVDHFDPPKSHFEPGGFDALPEDFNFEDLLDDQPPDQSGLQVEASPSVLPDDNVPDEDQFDFEGFPEAIMDQPLGTAAVPPPELRSEPKEPSVLVKEPPLHQNVPRVEPSLPKVSKVRLPADPVGGERDRLFGVLMEAIGIDEGSPAGRASDENTVRLIGEMFREMIEGMMTLLVSRAELKSQFRMSVTTIRPVENNPLKFSVSVVDALNALLTPGQRGFLKPIDAIQNGFDDVSNHQLAMISGIQASVTDLLRKFDPERFEKQIEASVFSKKDAKCWEAYSNAYQRLVTEATDEFFGDTFVKAYEKQMQILVSINGGN